MSEADQAEYILRVPTPDDTERIREFTRLIWPNKSTERLLQRWWWNDASPHSLVAEHRNSGEIAAVCGARRVRFVMDGTLVDCVSFCDWYVSPHHQGKGLGKTLVQAASKNAEFCYGTSGCQSGIAGLAKMWGWEGDMNIPIHLGFTLAGATCSLWNRCDFDIRSTRVNAATPFDVKALNELWETACPADYSGVVRNGDALRAHLLLAPHRDYGLLMAYKNQKLCGYCLYRLLPRRAFRRMPWLPWLRIGLITDIFVDERIPGVAQALLSSACRAFVASGAFVVSALSTRPVYLKALAETSFVSNRSLPFRRLLASIHTRIISSPGLTAHSGKWQLTFVDNDMDLLFGSANEFHDPSQNLKTPR